MRKISISEFVSLDGMISNPGDTMKWVTAMPLNLVGTGEFGNGVVLHRDQH